MRIDARALPSGHRLTADVCVVGGGAAGLTIAQELARFHARVVVLESGEQALRHAAQCLHEGVVAGHPYYPLDACRFRVLGGSTAHWGGWCMPLGAMDFEHQDWVPGSGWPFTKDHLEPFYRRAQQICRLGPYDYDPARWRREDMSSLVGGTGGSFQDAVFQIQPTRFGELYGGPSGESRGVDLVLNATVLEVRLDGRAQTVTEARAATLGGTLLTVRAGVFVLATGGIENARILLLSQGAGRRAVGNDRDLVGRYFGDHLHVPIGVMLPREGAAEFYRARSQGGVSVRGAIVLSEACRRRDRALGFAATLHDADDPHDVLSLAQASRGYASLQHVVQSLRRGRLPDRALHHLGAMLARAPEVCRVAYRRLVKRPARMLLIGCRAEQAPNRESRVTLDASRDRFGLRRVRLDWTVSADDIAHIESAQSRLADALRDHAVEMFPAPISRRGGWSGAIAGGAHHMGTTRMHRDPRAGVVDEQCRVHGTTNLYVAGSSVFPTGGWAPPTLTIVALAVRLAEHLGAGLPRGRA